MIETIQTIFHNIGIIPGLLLFAVIAWIAGVLLFAVIGFVFGIFRIVFDPIDEILRSRAEKRYCDKGEHIWSECRCSICGTSREHLWENCACSRCGFVDETRHELGADCICKNCGAERHDMVEGACSRCGVPVCSTCGGLGQVPNSCSRCSGSGIAPDGAGGSACDCGGIGDTCPDCGGSGVSRLLRRAAECILQNPTDSGS